MLSIDTSEIENNFLYNSDWKLNEPYMRNYEKAIISVYFAFTSLSTVGFGDFHPISNQERLLGAAMLLFGVAIFSYCMGKFVDIFNEIISFNASLNDGGNLNKFFGLL
jgi:hypothetical protein